jgi:hypothetical protein
MAFISVYSMVAIRYNNLGISKRNTLNNIFTALYNETELMDDTFIFLAEDDIDDQELLVEAFAQLDKTISVKALNNGKKALSFLENLLPEQNPCLIVLDYNLSELSGAEIPERLNQF